MHIKAERSLPDLARPVERRPRPEYRRAIDFKTTVSTGRKQAPSGGGVGPELAPLSRRLALEAARDVEDPWFCNVGGAACIKPAAMSPEPAVPVSVWVCDACDWCVCHACYVPSARQHPHPLYREDYDE